MKSIIMAVIVAAGIGLMGATGASAAPANGAVIDQAAAQGNMVQHVQHWRWRSRGWAHSRGRSRGVVIGHYRWRSLGWGHSRGRSAGYMRCHNRRCSGGWHRC